MTRSITADDGPGRRLRHHMPGWAASLVVHVIALLVMALVVSDPPRRLAALSIVVAPADRDDEMPDFDTALPPLPATADPVPFETVAAPAVEADQTISEVPGPASEPELPLGGDGLPDDPLGELAGFDLGSGPASGPEVGGLGLNVSFN